MMTTKADPHDENRRRSDNGAVLMVVLIVMVALLGLGMTGLFLTSGSVQMNTNINLRNQALMVAEAGIERARGILNNSGWTPPLPTMLAGLNTSSGDEVPTSASDCQGASSRGAILVDQITPGCTEEPTPASCKLQDIIYQPIDRSADLPSSAGTVPAKAMGQYTVYIRQDQGDCRMGNFTCDMAPGAGGSGACSAPEGAPSPNGAIIVRSEGVASDNRTRVVLEVTLVPSQGPNQAANTPLSALCAVGASGCDDNASVQSGIVVNSPITQNPPGTGGVEGTGGVVGTGGEVGTGGVEGTGGVVGTGGEVGTGGVVGTGGEAAPGTGGVVGTGGVGTGGAPGTGGIKGTGGSTPTACPPGTVLRNGVCKAPCLINAIQAVGTCGGGKGCYQNNAAVYVNGNAGMKCDPSGCSMNCQSYGGCSNHCVCGTISQDTTSDASKVTTSTLPAPPKSSCSWVADMQNQVWKTLSTSNNLPTCVHNANITGGTLTLNSGNYIIEHFELDSPASIYVNDTAGPVRLWVEQIISMDGVVTVKSGRAGNFWFIYNGTSDYNNNSGNAFTGIIFAPGAKVNLNYHIKGAVLASNVMMNSGSYVNYDSTACW